ncbi:protein ALP1-like [Gigantopelta aegis]|uniref:protein ALP1-like n=1 Tax=Gigantopelta aegis TaxID=1735272 RepID=UPI001B88C91A|nr:protein ALP1-like [Gigantopelta aegis]
MDLQLANAALALDQDILQNRLLLQTEEDRRRRTGERTPRTMFCRDWFLRREEFSQYHQLMEELRREDVDLVDRLSPRIKKKDTWFQKALPPGLKVTVTLRHLATGDSYHSLMYSFTVAHNTISYMVKEVCEAIVAEYSKEVLNIPTDPDAWRSASELFNTRWQFPHAVGALDGKHVAIKKKKKGESMYFNYKRYHSIVLMALVDADYKFMWVNVGSPGSCSDAQIWNDCDLREHIFTDRIGWPQPDPLPHDDTDTPYYIIGDEAFALRTWLMKPFSRRHMDHEERIFNYRLSRARRVVENAFGILANCFSCLLTTLRHNPSTVESIVLACVCLHNVMRILYPQEQNGLIDNNSQGG